MPSSFFSKRDQRGKGQAVNFMENRLTAQNWIFQEKLVKEQMYEY